MKCVLRSSLVPVVFPFIAMVVVGCGAGVRVGTFSNRGFVHATLDYGVSADAEGRLAGADWLLDNHRFDSSGAPTVAKTGPGYVVRRRADRNGDGVLEDYGDVPAYDLRFVNRRDAGVMFVRTVPLPNDMAEMDLRVLMRLYVEAAAGTGIALSDLGDGRMSVDVRHYATRELEGRATAVDGREAYESVVESADVDQLALDPGTRWQRSSILLVRTGLWMPLGSRWRDEDLRHVLMIIGYTNLPEDYDAHAADLAWLVSRVHFEITSSAAAASLACIGGSSASFVVYAGRHLGGVAAPGYSRLQQDCLVDVAASERLSYPRAYAYIAQSARSLETAAPAPEPSPTPSVDPVVNPVADSVVSPAATAEPQ